jgi:hypothetical protein
MVTFLLVMGVFATLVGWVWIMVTAFSESVPWGVGIIFFWPLALVYGILNWEDTKIPTIMMGSGILLYILSVALAAAMGS